MNNGDLNEMNLTQEQVLGINSAFFRINALGGIFIGKNYCTLECQWDLKKRLIQGVLGSMVQRLIKV